MNRINSSLWCDTVYSSIRNSVYDSAEGSVYGSIWISVWVSIWDSVTVNQYEIKDGVNEVHRI